LVVRGPSPAQSGVGVTPDRGFSPQPVQPVCTPCAWKPVLSLSSQLREPFSAAAPHRAAVLHRRPNFATTHVGASLLPTPSTVFLRLLAGKQPIEVGPSLTPVLPAEEDFADICAAVQAHGAVLMALRPRVRACVLADAHAIVALFLNDALKKRTSLNDGHNSILRNYCRVDGQKPHLHGEVLSHALLLAERCDPVCIRFCQC